MGEGWGEGFGFAVKGRGRESIAATVFHMDNAYRNRLPTPSRPLRNRGGSRSLVLTLWGES
jgi:hypothetical protein